jgi:hypothetical protein
MRETCGSGVVRVSGGVVVLTVMAMAPEALPAESLRQVRVRVVFLVMPVMVWVWVPSVLGTVPLHPFAPEAWQVMARVTVQETVIGSPGFMLVLSAVKGSSLGRRGSGGMPATVMVAVCTGVAPPGPVQKNWRTALLVKPEMV